MKIEFEENIRRTSHEVSGYRVPEKEVKTSTTIKVTLTRDEVRRAIINFIDEHNDDLQSEVPLGAQIDDRAPNGDTTVTWTETSDTDTNDD